MNGVVCVVIPTLNEEENIGELLDSLNAQSYKRLEVHVVDDGSTDNTVAIARAKGAIVSINIPGRQGPAFGWNKISRKTKAELFCFIGADFYFEDTNYFQTVLNAFTPDTVAVFTAYHTLRETLVEKALTREHGMGFDPRVLRTRDFLEMGGFPQIGYGEDQVLVSRLKKYCRERGKKTVVLRSAFFSGHGVHTLKEMMKQATWYGKTGVPFLGVFHAENPLAATLKAMVSTYSRAVYSLSFACLLVSPFFPAFLVLSLPFLLSALKLLVSSVREGNPYGVLRIPLFIAYGFGLLHGLALYLFRADKKMGS